MRDRPLERPYNECAKEANTSMRLNLRNRLEIQITRAQEQIKFNEHQIKEVEAALALLNKNKDLETLVNLLDR